MARHWAVAGVRQLLVGSRPGVIEFPSPMDGQLTQVQLQIAAANPAGDALFDVNVDGVTVYGSPADQPKILAGGVVGTSVINVELLIGQLVSVDLDAAPLGGISGLYVLVQIDDAPTVSQYVKNVYKWAFLRAPSGGELAAAVAALGAGCGSGTLVAASKVFLDSIFTDATYTSRARSDADYVEDLYQAIQARPSEPGGKAAWVAVLGTDTRQHVLDGFTFSIEHAQRRLIGFCPTVLPLTDARALWGKGISSTAPSVGQLMQYDGSQWVAATVDYLSSVFDFKPSARAATTVALPSYMSTAGVITATANGALPTQDGVALAVADRLLVKNETGGSQKYNGLYVVTQLGAGGSPFILTRAADANTSARVTANMFVPVEEGTANADTSWQLTTNNPITLDTTALTFAQFGASGSPSGSAGGDLGSTYPNPTVVKLQGRTVDSAAPNDKDTLAWDNPNSKWKPTAPGGGFVVPVTPPGPASGFTTVNTPSTTDLSTGAIALNETTGGIKGLVKAFSGDFTVDIGCMPMLIREPSSPPRPFCGILLWNSANSKVMTFGLHTYNADFWISLFYYSDFTTYSTNFFSTSLATFMFYGLGFWFRLKRVGTVWTGYVSPDGQNWHSVGTTSDATITATLGGIPDKVGFGSGPVTGGTNADQHMTVFHFVKI